MNMQEPYNAEIIAALNDAGISTKNLIQKVGEEEVIIRKQELDIAFSEINTDAEKLTKMPSLKEKIEWDNIQKQFKGIGLLNSYTVTKTF